MSKLKLPQRMLNHVEAHRKWLDILEVAQVTVEEDSELIHLASKGLRLKERALPPAVLGRSYARYCDLVNKMYDAYLNSIHLQRAPYMLAIITVFVKRLYELREELVHIIVNDYIYVDSALTQLKMTPLDIQIVVPYHYPLECRTDNIEQVLQKMWADAVRRKKIRDRPEPPRRASLTRRESNLLEAVSSTVEEVEVSKEETESPASSVHTLIPEEFIQASLIQRHERFREFMKIKRERVRETRRDELLGLMPDPSRSEISYTEENKKVYEKRRNTRMKIRQTYLQELENENTRLIMLKKDDQIDDITDEIRTWFQEWYYGYGFFPEYPYEVEGGTIMVLRGEYPTVEEQKEHDEWIETTTKGKTKDQLKAETAQAKAEARLKAEALKIAQKKDAIQILKLRCNPFTDPGYKPQASHVIEQLIEALKVYKASWSLYDALPPERYGEAIYGYMKPLLIEDLMSTMHKDCRKFVDEMMRLDLKLLIQMQREMYKSVGWKYPKIKARKKPKDHPLPKTLVVNEKVLNNVQQIFDLGIITKPTTKFSDIYGDTKYAAYDFNIRDPDAKFPLPGYADIKSRLMLSCVFGCGIEPGAPKKKAVMLLGPERNGKSFLVDAVAGELNAVKIDITPEGFSAVLAKPVKELTQAFLAARAFQPAVVFMRNIERVFAIKVPPEEKHLQANILMKPLTKIVRQLSVNDKVIFIATCTNPFVARTQPLVKLFDEIILVPRTDYGTLQQFFYQKLQSIRSIPRDFPVQPIAQLIQGYGFGVIIEAYNDFMTPERIVRLNVDPLAPGEILDVLLDKGVEPLTLEDYQKYIDFIIANTPLKAERKEFERINIIREDAYKQMEKKLKADQSTPKLV